MRLVSRMLSEMGHRPVLVSDELEDVNRAHCAAHVVVDWETASLEELVAAVGAAGVVPTAVVGINPRPGGRMYRSATQRACGVDSIDMPVRMALAERLDGVLAEAATGGTELPAMLPFEADRVGTLASATSVEEIKRIPGVVDGYLFEDFRVVTTDRENLFAEAMIAAGSVAEPHRTAERVRSVFTFTFE